MVVGAGSGRDIYSSILISERLISLGLVVDLAGFLTPWSVHLFDGKIEKPVNLLKTSDCEKFLPYREKIFINDHFIEKHLLDFNENFDLRINKFWLFSLFQGTIKLKDEIEQMVNQEAYDIIIAVDVGGDILADGLDYQFLITPIVDLSCLTILKEIKTNAQRILTIISPGSCGELPPNSILRHLDRNSLLFEEQIFDYDTMKFIQVNEKLNNISKNYSSTFNVIRNIIKNDTLIQEKIKIIRINNKKYEIPYKLNLDSILLKKIVYFDLVKYSNSSPVLHYNNLFQAAEIMLNKKVIDVEVSFSCLVNNIDEKSSLFPIYLLIFNKNFPDQIRSDILKETFLLLNKGAISGILMLKKDLSEAQTPPNLSKYSRGNLKIVYKQSSSLNERTFNNLFNYTRKES